MASKYSKQTLLDSITYHAPCVIGGKAGLSQLEDRVAIGVTPSIHFKKRFEDKDIFDLEVYIQNNNITGISFNLGPYNATRQLEEYRYFIETIANLASKYPEQVQRTAGLKYGTVIDSTKAFTGLASSIDMETYETIYNKITQSVRELSQLGQEYGVSLEVENGPNPDFEYDPDGKKVKGDAHPRWGKVWYARPAFDGTICAESTELIRLLKGLNAPNLALDLEHLIQTCQYGNIYNLQQARKGVLRVGDLTPEQKKGFETYDLGLNDKDILFDYSNLTKKEIKFLDAFGYVIRKGQPLVYRTGLTLREQLHILYQASLDKSLNISAITPGFQVYQGYFDTVGENKVLTISSHLPGVTRRYIKDRKLRQSLLEDIRLIHKMAFNFMAVMSIKDVEVEPQIDDGTNVQFGGPIWRQQVIMAIDQLEDNFTQATLNPRILIEDYKKGPYYIGSSPAGIF